LVVPKAQISFRYYVRRQDEWASRGSCLMEALAQSV
jgi:hypothetical protein